jgi:hypothetical protein
MMKITQKNMSADFKGMWTGLNGLGKPSVGGFLWNGSTEVLAFLQTMNILTNNQPVTQDPLCHVY